MEHVGHLQHALQVLLVFDVLGQQGQDLLLLAVQVSHVLLLQQAAQA